jgi:hypothetical protein
MNTDISRIYETESEFNAFCDILITAVCNRCRKLNKLLPNIQFKQPHGLISHHRGYINSIIKSNTDAVPLLDKFFNDPEHGFFHGLMTAFVAFLKFKENTKIDSEQSFNRLIEILSSCILHDILKCNAIPYCVSRHDEELKQFFSKLCPETFTHSDPKNDADPIVIADRMELQRYLDCDDWLDERFTTSLSSYNEYVQHWSTYI